MMHQATLLKLVKNFISPFSITNLFFFSLKLHDLITSNRENEDYHKIVLHSTSIPENLKLSWQSPKQIWSF